ncbi:MAG: NAD-glutamate dehydrogenase [Myxococcota bacterium]
MIVPRGAKGTFVLNRPPADLQERRQIADKMYQVFINGLLSVTDNLVDGQVRGNTGVLCYDDPDHYLVVAADKGTAHLSDSANEVAESQSFWLGDAFASGGSQGYDHKKEGITARGAWECVKRHFREMDLSPEKDRLTVTGVGDMSGDVFGNGLLLSDSLQLVAAFDHRHVFLDPDPDPLTSFQIRKKLFDTPRSSWADYPAEHISTGGGVYTRGAKSIALSPEIRKRLGIAAESLSGQELIKAILRAPVDLFWNGGIGTYIKSTSETHLDVGDPMNDAVRVDASQVRAKVIGEGGNLGITHQGRVELASLGVRLNTDAIDNSAGVDLSDHEVNLKILFQAPIVQGTVSREQRNRFMEDVREEVNRMVLMNNWVQSRTLSFDQIRSKMDLGRFARTIQLLSERVPFTRQAMNLPDDAVLAQRSERQVGLYRPELAVLVANAKLDMRQELLRFDDFGLEYLSEYLFDYFPPAIVARFRNEIYAHPLAINIARCVFTNHIVGEAGATWLAETTWRTGQPTQDILTARLAASELIDAPTNKKMISAAEATLSTEVEYRLRLSLEDAIENVANWILRRERPLDDALKTTFRSTLKMLSHSSYIQGAEELAQRQHNLVVSYVPQQLAEKIVVLERVVDVLDIAELASIAHTSPERAGAAVYRIGEATGMWKLTRRALETENSQPLDRPARVALRDRIRKQLIEASTAILRHEEDLDNLTTTTVDWLGSVENEVKPLLTDKLELCDLVVAADRISRRLRYVPGRP